MIKAMATIALFMCAGCKEDYSDPKAFLQKWSVDREAKRYCSDARMKELRFSGIAMSDVRISTQYGMSVVCATMRFVPESDKIVYARIKPNFGLPGMRGGIEILTRESLDEILSADITVSRVKMDNGIYAPADMESGHKYISGWGMVNSLVIATDELIAASKQSKDSQVEVQDLKAKVTDMAKRGRALYVAIVKANTEREAAGMQTVWPVTAKKCSNDKQDISGMVFRDVISYFQALFDLPKVEKPYVAERSDLAFENGNGQILWNVAADLDDSISDQAPILISANFDCSNLPGEWPSSKYDIDRVIPLGSSPIIGNNGIVYITKGGKIGALPAEKVALRNIYGNDKMKLPSHYLTVKGMVNIRK